MDFYVSALGRGCIVDRHLSWAINFVSNTKTTNQIKQSEIISSYLHQQIHIELREIWISHLKLRVSYLTKALFCYDLFQHKSRDAQLDLSLWRSNGQILSLKSRVS